MRPGISSVSSLALLGLVLGAVRIAEAQHILVGPGGPSGYSAESVYGPPFGPPPLTGPGATPLLLPPPPPNPAAPPGTYVVDALASGGDAGSIYLYSVGLGAVGLPASPVAFEVLVGTPLSQFFPGPPAAVPLPPEAAGDSFVLPAGPVFGLAFAALPLAFPAVPADEFMLGLNVGDNLNGFAYRVPILGIGTFLYSLAVGGLGPSPYLPADIISPILPLGVPWAPALALSLDSLGPGSDDIDALIVQDLGPVGFGPGDFVAFSLTPASATLTIAGPGYAPGGGDLLVPDGADADPLPDIFIPAVAFGLAPGDNLDAIEVAPLPPVVPALPPFGPALLVAALMGSVLLSARRRLMRARA